MVNSVALCAIVLPLLVVTGSASVQEDSVSPMSSVDVDLGLNPPTNGKVAAAWWAGWHSDLLPLDKISWKKYTHMTYAFA
jgi:hypothetical protein